MAFLALFLRLAKVGLTVDLRQRLKVVSTTSFGVAVGVSVVVFTRSVSCIGFGKAVHVGEFGLSSLGGRLLASKAGLALSTAENNAVKHSSDSSVPVTPEEANVGGTQRVFEHVGHLDIDQDTKKLEQSVTEERERHKNADTKSIAVAVVGKLAHVAGKFVRRDKVKSTEHGDGLDGDLGHSFEIFETSVAFVSLFGCSICDLVKLLGESPELSKEAREAPRIHFVLSANVEDVPDEQARTETKRRAPKVQKHDSGSTRKHGPSEQRTDERENREPFSSLRLDGHLVVEEVSDDGRSDDEAKHAHSNDTGSPKRVRWNIVFNHLEAQVTRYIQSWVGSEQLEAKLGMGGFTGQASEESISLVFERHCC